MTEIGVILEYPFPHRQVSSTSSRINTNSMYTASFPVFMVSDMAKSVLFYKDTLGFTLEFMVDNQHNTITTVDQTRPIVFAMFNHKGCVKLSLESQRAFEEDIPDLPKGTVPGSTISLYFHVTDVETLHERIQDSVTISSPLKTSWYGMKEFVIRDPDGYILTFGQPLSSTS